MSSGRRDDPIQAAVFDFLSAYYAAQEAGRQHGLSWWLARYPGCEEAIAREYLSLTEPAPAPERAASADEQRVGPYRILRELGRGGQGAVYLAEDTRIARQVALKVLAQGMGAISEERRARLRREAEVIARLDHPGICTIHEAEIQTDPPYLAMRYVEGVTLAAHLAHGRSTPGSTEPETPLSNAWPPRSTLDIHAILAFFERAARALHAAHEAGVIHRDIKPGNIMVSSAGEPVLLDFGLARDEAEVEHEALTMEGDVLGTPAYMSPEQLREASAALDRRTDVYSLGATLYEALTLRRPFERKTRAELFRAIETETPSDPRTINPALGHDIAVVLSTALAKEPKLRYASAFDFAEDLRRIRVYEPIRARPVGWWIRTWRWTQRNPWLAATLLVLVGALVVALDSLHAERAALRDALGRHLGSRAQALTGEDPSAAVVLGAQACELAPNYLTRAALLAALDACALEREERFTGARTSEDFALDARGQRLAMSWSGFEDQSTGLHIRDLAAGGTARKAEGQHGVITRVLHSTQHAAWLTAAKDGLVRLLDQDSGARRKELDLGRPLKGMELASSEDRIFVRDDQDGLHLLSVPQLELIAKLRDKGTQLACFDASGKRLLEIQQDGATLNVYSSSDGTLLAQHACPARWARVLQRDPQAQSPYAWIGTQEGELARIHLETGAIERLALDRFALPVESMVFDPTGRWLLVLLAREERGSAWLIERESLRLSELLPEDSRVALRAAFRFDGGRVALACSDMSVRIFECSSARLVKSLRGRFRAQDLLWSPDGSRLYTRNVGAVLMSWHADTRPDVQRFEAPAPIVELAYSAQRKRITCTSSNGMRYEFDPSGPRADEPCAQEPLLSNPATRGQWQLASGVLRERFDSTLVCERPDGSGVAWELELAKKGSAQVRELVIAPNGREFTVVTNRIRSMRVDARSGAILEELRPFVARSARYSADSLRLLLVGEHGGGAFRLLELSFGPPPSRIVPIEIFHTTDLCLGEFGPDGESFLTASRDGVVFVRDARGGLPLTQFRTDGTPTAMAVEGGRVLIGTSRGVIHSFPIDPLAGLAQRLPRSLDAWEIGNERRLALPLRYNP